MQTSGSRLWFQFPNKYDLCRGNSESGRWTRRRHCRRFQCSVSQRSISSETWRVLMVVGLPEKDVTLNALHITRGAYRARGDSTRILQRIPETINSIVKRNIHPEIE